MKTEVLSTPVVVHSWEEKIHANVMSVSSE